MIDSEQPLKLLSRSLKAPSLPVHSGDREEKSGSIKHPSSFPAVDASALYQLTHVPLSICLPVRLPHVSRFPTISMGMRRMTRLTNGFSKKWENLQAAYSLWFAYFFERYSFLRDEDFPAIVKLLKVETYLLNCREFSITGPMAAKICQLHIARIGRWGENDLFRRGAFRH